MRRDGRGDVSKGSPILVVDDDVLIGTLVQEILRGDGYTDIHVATDASSALRIFEAVEPALVLLDLTMGDVDGLELMRRLAGLAGEDEPVPCVVLTADTRDDTRHRALAAGASDFLTKPLDRIELLLRVGRLLHITQLQKRLREHNQDLIEAVAHRTRELERARVEILERLALAAEYRDDDTQEHAWRIGRTCALLAVALGLPDDLIEVIGRAAPLHDVGKIGVSDSILLKPGHLSPGEYERMKSHTTIGAEILAGSQSALLRLAAEIALTHHEHWDGGGYPRALRREEIPLAGRIVAVADVFDALVHERPYKHAWPLTEALQEINAQAGTQFDRAIGDAFTSLSHESLSISAHGWRPPTVDRRPHTAGSVFGRAPGAYDRRSRSRIPTSDGRCSP
jgi:putative two-component system response regulator